LCTELAVFSKAVNINDSECAYLAVPLTKALYIVAEHTLGRMTPVTSANDTEVQSSRVVGHQVLFMNCYYYLRAMLFYLYYLFVAEVAACMDLYNAEAAGAACTALSGR
jgi:hypothetical protein